jgi:transposase, IS5 family
VEQARRKYGVSERYACRVLGQWRGTQRYLPMDRTDEEALTEAMIALAIEYGRYGYRRIAVKLREAETLAAAYRGGALSVKATEAVAVDTTVQEKAIAHPTEHGLLLTAIEQLGAQAKKSGLRLRQSYVRVARRAAMKTGRDLHAQQRKRANKQVKFLRVRLRRLQRDIRRKMASAVAMAERQRERLEVALAKAWRIAQQRRGDPGYLYSWHATEVECISKGKARAPYEFGCKVSLATNLHPAKGGHFILHAQALHGNPYDGHTLAAALEDIRKTVGRVPQRVAVDQRYKGHRITLPHTAVYLTGQRRGVTETIKRWLKRRAVVEPVIGHAKNDGLLGRNWLAGRAGDRSNALLAAVGFNLRQLLRFLKRTELFLCPFLRTLFAAPLPQKQTRPLLDACTRNDPAVYFLKFNY